MTSNFDFSAFLNSPVAGNDTTSAFGAVTAPAMATSFSSDMVSATDNNTNNVSNNNNNSFDNSFSYDDSTVILPDWASNTNFLDIPSGTGANSAAPFLSATTESNNNVPSVANAPNQAFAQPVIGPQQVDTSMKENDAQGGTNVGGHAYRASIAAHHLTQLGSWLPQAGGGAGAGGVPAGLGGAGQRSQGGSHSAPSVPLSQAGRLPKNKMKSSMLTIQERRRLARRGQSTAQVNGSGNGHTISQPTGLRHVVQADSTPSSSSAGPPTDVENGALQSSANATTVADSHEAPLVVPTVSNLSGDILRRAYSSTGFDLIGALIKVATRPNPKIEIGPVDLSCSFTVSDATHPEQPIVHCSDSFCQLTGYDRTEIIGRNCRFLQSPDGNVKAGSERTHTDNGAVRHIKKHMMRMQECQTSLINYRRDGSPFINLVTIVPITWENSAEPVLLVGFQVDLVEQPGAVVERKSNGLYVVNYSQPKGEQAIPFYSQPHTAHDAMKDAAEAEASKKAIMAQELAEMITSGNEESTRWARILLDNSHDIIHVLSLKGTFLYVSPSVEKLLGYKPEELVGKSISEFCHPSDVVPVFRELKDSTSNASIAAAARHWARFDGTVNPPTKGGSGQTGPQVNLIMRMKHKQYGHEWIENVGKLHLEQGKGRKVVISSGRLRPIYNLPWEQAQRSLNSRAPGFWYKTSTSGLVLSTSGTVSDVVEGGSPTTEHIVPFAGKHIKDFVDKNAFGALENALKSLQVSAVPHMMTNGLGGPAQMVITTVIPSSAGGQGLPTVFVYTQRANPNDFVNLQKDAIYCQDASLAAAQASQAATLKVGEPAAGSVFGELSTFRSSSWVFELHQLKNANKRLREEIRAHQRRITSANRMTVGLPHQSPTKTKPAAPTKTPTQLTRPPLNPTEGKPSSGSGNSSEETQNSQSPTPFSGSGSDSTGATSGGSQPPSNENLKRPRSEVS